MKEKIIAEAEDLLDRLNAFGTSYGARMTVEDCCCWSAEQRLKIINIIWKAILS